MSLLDANDQPGVYPPSWYSASANKALDLAPLKDNIRVEICVIGAGFSGLSAALHLAQAGKNVCVVDAHRVGWGASGRNGGQLGSGQRLEQVELERQVGGAVAHSLWKLAEDSKRLVKSLIADHDIDCSLKPGVLHTNHRARFNKHTAHEVKLLNEEYGYDKIRYIGKEECRQMVGSNAYHGGSLDKDAGHLHPLNFALGLAEAAIECGASIFEQTRALAIDHGDKVIVTTNEGSIVADELVIACNGYLGKLDKSVSQRVMPINNFIVATRPLPEEQARALIRDDVAVADSKFVVNYFRLSEDRRLLFGGGESYGYRFPPDIRRFVRKPLTDIFPQLADIELEYGWGGTLAITMSRLPHYANIRKNIRSISGYSGHGLGMATLAGKLTADAIGGATENFEMFRAIGAKKFPGGLALRSPLLVLAMLYHAMLDRF